MICNQHHIALSHARKATETETQVKYGVKYRVIQPFRTSSTHANPPNTPRALVYPPSTPEILITEHGDTATMAETSATRVTRKNKEDLVRDSQLNITGHESARKWLNDNELTLKGEVPTMSSLIAALLQLCSGRFLLPKDMVTGMRAIALCMEELMQTRHTNTALDTIKEQVEEMVKEAKDSIEELVGGVRTAMKDTEERLKSQTGGIDSSNVEKIIEKAVSSAAIPSYAQALMAEKDPHTTSRDLQINNDAKIRGQLQRRQIILDGDDATKTQTAKLTPKELVMKANLALEKLDKDMAETLSDDNNERPPEAKFVAARLLKNGGVLFEMESENGADWLKQTDITKAFEKCFPGVVTIKGNNYQVVVQFLPISLKNHLETHCAAIENENGLTKGSIVNAKWMRNPANWGTNQTKAHAIFSIKSRNDANDIINQGMLIDGSRHDARKLEEDPKRCFKCQIIGTGHNAANCKSNEICANCAKEHPTGECGASRADFRCATCKKDKRQDDHAAWDRQCPAFLEEKARLRDRKPENHFRFYPSEHDSWTWVRHEDSLADGYTDRWTGNDPRRGAQRPTDPRRDNGYGRPLGNNLQRRTDTWTPRTGDSWVAHDSYRPDNRRQHSGDRNRSRERRPTSAPRGTQRRDERSRSRGRPSQQQGQKDKDPRQSSLINWATSGDKSRERSNRDEGPSERNRPNEEYRSSQPSRK